MRLSPLQESRRHIAVEQLCIHRKEISMNLSRLWQVIITVVLVLGLYMPPVTAAETLSPRTDTFNALVQECLELQGETSLSACDQAIEMHPDDVIPWYGRSRVLSALGQQEEANQSYARVRVIQAYYNAIAQLLAQQEQIESLMQNDEQFSQLEAAINSEDMEQEQLEQLQQLKQQILTLRENPSLLDEEIADAMLQVRDRLADIIGQISATAS
ncbi:tetratricopeptide repeat protein [Coleofasciculus sp. F4-SAH-05]|uniref:tetratricopeptide repeat protein n=1 Tax=Coleofasciculus sp. F4-SAH-05 TaxID=3069525 RepID=UPI00330411C5